MGRIDRERVVRMAATGFTRKEIARRMDCSSKQISRIVKEMEIPVEKNPLLEDKECEGLLRDMYLSGENAREVAVRFGITRQGIMKRVV